MNLEIPVDLDDYEVKCGKRKIAVTNLRKVFWPGLRKTKRDLLLYYAAVSEVILPHLKDRAMVMKRFPNGIHEKFFFMKRTPTYHPEWLSTCAIIDHSGRTIHFPILQNSASLLWVVNLGCVDLNPWYARCGDTNLPDYLHLDLDPVPPARFEEVRKAALLIREYLQGKSVEAYPKTSGSRGIHLYVPLQQKATQKEVWQVAKRLALEVAKLAPALLTSEYRVAKRPAGRVLVDYNQNAWGRTLASVYSVRPVEQATVSAPVTWEELEQGVSLSDFTMDTMPARIRRVGDLFRPLLRPTSKSPLEALL